jgi:hypothetical protein
MHRALVQAKFGTDIREPQLQMLGIETKENIDRLFN